MLISGGGNPTGAELARLFGVVFGDILTLRMQLIIYFFVLIEDIIKIGDVKQFR